MNYVLIDFENVQPESIDRLAHEHFKVRVFVGASQTKIPFDMARSLQRLGAHAEYIKIAGNGPNALDFHIAYYLGQLSAADPAACYHLVSRDAGFDPLIQHLKAKKLRVGRVPAIADIPLGRAMASTTPAEQLPLILARLQQLKSAKPRTVKTLSSTIASLFQRQVTDEEIAVLVRALVEAGYAVIEGVKISYALPGAPERAVAAAPRMS